MNLDTLSYFITHCVGIIVLHKLTSKEVRYLFQTMLEKAEKVGTLVIVKLVLVMYV